MEAKNSDNDHLAMYLIVRSCLNMSPGKVAAQVGHGVAQIYDLMEGYMISSEDDKVEITDDFWAWKEDSFRKIILRASELEWIRIINEVPEIYRETVVDGGFTEIPPNTETVIALVPMRKSQAPQAVKDLKTY